MVSIPAGAFLMGNPDGEGDPDEHPQHRVSVAAFAMDVTEVTVAAYARCVSAGACAAAGSGQYCNAADPGRANHPVNCVDWSQATAYCGWAGKRLPTEEEWEYAARGTDGRKYPWGNAPPGASLCWSGEGNDLGRPNRRSTCPVGSYPAGVFGLKDMAGNVWEWTSSGYSDGYDKGRVDGRRVHRGGGWNDNYPSNVRSPDRGAGTPTYRYYNLGFRCARTL